MKFDRNYRRFVRSFNVHEPSDFNNLLPKRESASYTCGWLVGSLVLRELGGVVSEALQHVGLLRTPFPLAL